MEASTPTTFFGRCRNSANQTFGNLQKKWKESDKVASVKNRVFTATSKMQASAASFKESCRAKAGEVKFLARLYTVKNELQKTSRNTNHFFKENQKTLMVYTAAWLFLIGYMGAVHGFARTAKRLTMGMASGAGLGLISGLIATKKEWACKQNEGKNTLWDVWDWNSKNRLNLSTRFMVTTAGVSAVFNAIPTFPLFMGNLFGFVIGNHLSTKAIRGERMGSGVLNSEGELQKNVENLRKRVGTLEDWKNGQHA